jgi:hypothetical protein
MTNIPESYLPPNSQPWARWVTSNIRSFFAKREEYDLAVQNSIRQLNIAIPQPMRGLLVRQTTGTVTITTTGVYVPINLAGTLDTDITFNMVAASAPNVSGVKNDTDQTRTMLVIGSYDGKAGNNHVLGLKFAVDGVALNDTECTSFGGPGGQFAKVITHSIIRLGPDEEVSLLAANLTGTTNIDIARYRITTHAIP